MMFVPLLVCSLEIFLEMQTKIGFNDFILESLGLKILALGSLPLFLTAQVGSPMWSQMDAK